jgi:Domain of unknown function (DUF4333)
MRRRSRTRRNVGQSLVVGALVATSLALGACGSSESTATLNTEKIERAIAKSSLAQRGQHAQVSCPSGVSQEKGLEFSCTAKVGQVSTEFVVVQRDGSGHVHYEAPR